MHLTQLAPPFKRVRFALLALALALAGPVSAFAQPKGAWHPEVFSMVESWWSDVASPVVTEVNLDAVQRNRNQFSQDEIKQEDGWVVYYGQGSGFKRYRVIEQKGNQYKVEFQDNGGGSLTTASQIGFALDKREVQVDGKPKVINVLRVISFSR